MGRNDEILFEADRLISLTDQKVGHVTTEDDHTGMTFLKADLNGFYGDFSKVVTDHYNIFKEYQKFDWELYRKARIEVLNKLAENSVMKHDEVAQRNLKFEMMRIKAEIIKIGLYAGTFNPYHAGHDNIRKKAEQIFDKVIIGFARNPAKEKHTLHVPHSLKYHQVEPIEGLLTDFIASKDYHITIIKGLRNSTDMNVSVNQIKWMEQLKGGKVDAVSLFCDQEFEFVSSTDLRQIATLCGKDHPSYTKYVIK